MAASPYQTAIKLLARREHSRAELQQKLIAKFPQQREVLDDLLGQLVSENWQSDTLFAEAYLRSRANQGYGWQRIRMELQQRGIADNLAKTAYENSEIDWDELKAQVEHKKFGDVPADDWAAQQKRLQYLYRRGF